MQVMVKKIHAGLLGELSTMLVILAVWLFIPWIVADLLSILRSSVSLAALRSHLPSMVAVALSVPWA
jgi:membrane protein CcdC involved in cytochrome C biogenesis